jgi:hypothetical protein
MLRLSQDAGDGVLMSRTVLAVLILVLATEAAILVLGGAIDGHWRGVKWMAIFAVAWVADILLGSWITRRPDVLAARRRYSLIVLAMMMGAFAAEQVVTWVSAGPP